jgi:dTDP-glucose 4,6-dehydratase
MPTGNDTFNRPVEDANILVTGGAGFIGSAFIRHLLANPAFRGNVVNYDKLTYAGNLQNLADVAARFGGGRYALERGDVCDRDNLRRVLRERAITLIVHFAAESHVDRSILGPGEFIRTNIEGTFCLLEEARGAWRARKDVLFHHVSTDEVYGSLDETGSFRETTPYDPRSPYSASKAASDHLVRAWHHTYGLPVTLSNCSNNYGPRQFPEKLIPLTVLNAAAGKPLPVYGDGKNVRDWLYVDDHCDALWTILSSGRAGETYNIGGSCEKQNIEVVLAICDELDSLAREGHPRVGLLSGDRCRRELVTFVADRPGHDRRYAIDCGKLRSALGWRHATTFHEGLRRTALWYLENPKWLDAVQTGGYRHWMEQNYGGRTAGAGAGL